MRLQSVFFDFCSQCNRRRSVASSENCEISFALLLATLIIVILFAMVLQQGLRFGRPFVQNKQHFWQELLVSRQTGDEPSRRRVSAVGAEHPRTSTITTTSVLISKAWARANIESALAPIEVGQLPFCRNYAHLPQEPAEFWIEVGANSRELLRDEMIENGAFQRGAFLVSFEPLLDKYASGISAGGARTDLRQHVGLQHERGIILPYAVGCGAGIATFNVYDVDGCSSLLEGRGKQDFNADPKRSMWPGTHDWVAEKCIEGGEKRTVPCISLEKVLKEWLEGKEVSYIKIDAQGFDLEVVKSAGRMVHTLKRVKMEVHCDNAAMLYKGEENCSSVIMEMTRMGFTLEGDPQICRSCVETDLEFVRSTHIEHDADSHGKEFFASQVGNNTEPCAATGGTPILAPVQVARLPLSNNFAHLRQEEPTNFWIEVGGSDRKRLLDEFKTTPFQYGRFLVSFEPLLNKYAAALSAYGGKSDSRQHLGLQHERGIILPYAVGCGAEVATFNIDVIHGCSSSSDERSKPDIRTAPSGNRWPVTYNRFAKRCIEGGEKRTAPCISLEKVIVEWLEGKDVSYIKIDAQGSDLHVVKSAGRMVHKLKKVHMRAQCDDVAVLHKRRENCSYTIAEMNRLGFKLNGHTCKRFCKRIPHRLRSELRNPQMCSTCIEASLEFIRS